MITFRKVYKNHLQVLKAEKEDECTYTYRYRYTYEYRYTYDYRDTYVPAEAPTEAPR